MKRRRSLGRAGGRCKAVRGRRHVVLCFVGKSRKHPSGWAFKARR